MSVDNSYVIEETQTKEELDKIINDLTVNSVNFSNIFNIYIVILMLIKFLSKILPHLVKWIPFMGSLHVVLIFALFY